MGEQHSLRGKLEVKTTSKNNRRHQGAGKVLTSDANGLATWEVATGGSGLPDGSAAGNTPYRERHSLGSKLAIYNNGGKHRHRGNTTAQHLLSVGAATVDAQLVGLRVHNNTPLNRKLWRSLRLPQTLCYSNNGPVKQRITIAGHDSILGSYRNLFNV